MGCDMRVLNRRALTACVQFVLERLGLDYAAKTDRWGRLPARSLLILR